MSLIGKPTVAEPRGALTGDTSAALRPLQSVVASIRERLRLIESEVNTLITRVADLGTSGANGDVEDLRADLDALVLRVAALEALELTDWYVNGVFVATRRVVNFIQAGGITIAGADGGDRANITFGALVDLLIPITRGSSLVLTGREITLQRGRFITVDRGSLRLGGRTIGASLSTDTLLTVARGALRYTGRNVAFALSQDVDLPVTRGALRLSGRNVGLAANIALPVARGHLAITGRDVGMAVTTPSFTFFRSFADTSTANLTAFQGTVDASTGELVGTPASGSVHERVYFDLLPNDITGAWTVVVNLRAGVASTLNGILFNTQGDVGTDGTLQNGYWLDTLLSQPRFVKFVGGGGSLLASTALTLANPSEVTVSFDGVDTFHCEADGVPLFSDVVDGSAFTHGRIGLVFFANPGTPGSIIDFGINYTP